MKIFKKVSVVIPVYNENIDNILKLWEGLGYYNRARNFYKACQIVINKYMGEIHNEF